MRTPVMEMFGLDFPIFAFSHCRDVVAAVSRSGGLGTLGTSHCTPEQLERELSWIDEHSGGRPYGVDVLVPYGQPSEHENLKPADLERVLPAELRDFVEQLLQKYSVPKLSEEQSALILEEYMTKLTRTHREAEARLEVVFKHPQARLIVSALGPLPAHALQRAHALGKKVAGLIGHPRHALRQIEAGADIVIAQGWEAAGHTGELSTMVLVPEVVDLISPVPVLAAGGIGTGRQMAAAMALGAQGVWCGSIWLGTVESEVMPEIKQKLFAAGASDTVRSKCNTGKPARRLTSDWVAAWEKPGAPKPLPMPLQSMLVNDALERITRFKVEPLLSYPVGQIVGRINHETSCRQVIQGMVTEFSDTIAHLTGLAEE